MLEFGATPYVRYLQAPLYRLEPSAPTPAYGALEAWAVAVRGAAEACVLLDGDAKVVAASSTFSALTGVPAGQLVGDGLFDTVLEVLDFGAGHPVGVDELARVPPLLALTADALARSLLRVRRRDGSCVTVDAVSSPLHAATGDGVQGSVTFVRVV